MIQPISHSTSAPIYQIERMSKPLASTLMPVQPAARLDPVQDNATARAMSENQATLMEPPLPGSGSLNEGLATLQAVRLRLREASNDLQRQREMVVQEQQEREAMRQQAAERARQIEAEQAAQRMQAIAASQDKGRVVAAASAEPAQASTPVQASKPGQQPSPAETVASDAAKAADAATKPAAATVGTQPARPARAAKPGAPAGEAAGGEPQGDAAPAQADAQAEEVRQRIDTIMSQARWVDTQSKQDRSSKHPIDMHAEQGAQISAMVQAHTQKAYVPEPVAQAAAQSKAVSMMA